MKRKKDRGHSRFSPSAAHRWIMCPGSIPLVESLKLPDWTSHAAELGTATHTLLEMALNGKRSAHRWLGKKIDKFKVDKRMADAAESAYDHAMPVLESAVVYGVEDQFDIPATGQWGTMDIWALSYDKDFSHWILDVWDFKNGRHPVSARENPQIRLYANGVYEHTRPKHKGAAMPMRLHILQPNAYQYGDDGLDTWVTTSVKNDKWIAEMVKPAINAILKGTAKRIPGEHCRNCPGAGRCPELAAASMRAAKLDWNV